MGMKRLGIVALILGPTLSLVACGGSAAYPDADSVAKAAGFTNCSPDTEVISSDAVSCDEGRVNWFKSGRVKSSWNHLVAAIGDMGGPVLYGPNWAIECSSVGTCDAARVKLGGTIS